MNTFDWCLQLNIIIALLQPAPETYELFDDVMLMGDKKVGGSCGLWLPTFIQHAITRTGCMGCCVMIAVQGNSWVFWTIWLLLF